LSIVKLRFHLFVLLETILVFIRILLQDDDLVGILRCIFNRYYHLNRGGWHQALELASDVLDVASSFVLGDVPVKQ
jgi:hypothetical protein